VDEALYRAKQAGRDRVVSSDGSEVLSFDSMRLDWRHEWESGDAELDGQHRFLIEAANDLVYLGIMGVQGSEALHLVDSFLEGVSRHFEIEEKVLERLGYPERTAHAKHHAEALVGVLEHRQAYLGGGIENWAFFSYLADEVLLKDLLEQDLDFFPYVAQALSEARGSGEAAKVAPGP
jgi:hemerythrin-like metal-binding protein